jgi:hypothetical protein
MLVRLGIVKYGLQNPMPVRPKTQREDRAIIGGEKAGHLLSSLK